MNARVPAVISTVANSFTDFTLDIAVNRYNLYLILLGTSVGSFVLQIIYGFFLGFSLTLQAVPIVIAYGVCILVGYLFYALSLKKLPVGLTGLLESGSLFVFLFIDSLLGYFTITLYFIFLLLVFLCSIVLFSSESLRLKSFVRDKDVNLSGIVLLLFSMLFYTTEPYLIRLASNYGANEISINMGYYFVAIPYFGLMYKRSLSKTIPAAVESVGKSSRGSLKVWGFILLISVFESIYYLFGTMGFIGETPVINAILHEFRVFLLVILSVIAKTDKFSLKKVIALVLGLVSVGAIYFY